MWRLTLLLLLSVCGELLAQVAYTFDAHGLSSLTYNGVNYWKGGAYRTDWFYSTDYLWVGSGDVESSEAPSGCSYSSGADYAQVTCTELSWRQTYSQPTANALKSSITLTNSRTGYDIRRAEIYAFAFMAKTVLWQNTWCESIGGCFIRSTNEDVNFLGWLGEGATIILWSPLYGASKQWSVLLSQIDASPDYSRHVDIDWIPQEDDGPADPNSDYRIAPGASETVDIYLEWYPAGTSISEASANAQAAWLSQFPEMVSVKNRNPVYAWFIAEGTKRSATNPRGYYWDATFDASDVTAFHNRTVTQVAAKIAALNALAVKPKGVVIWDLEGQEFGHAMTYLGEPHQLACTSPDMDREADYIMAEFKAAGYEVGLTLRPQTFQCGTSLTATCSAVANYQDRYYKSDAPYESRMYICSATDTWTLNNPVDQVTFTTNAEALANLVASIDYSRSRWGATLFYVDSNVWHDGGMMPSAMWRTLQAAYPDSIFFPEWESGKAYGASMPYDRADMDAFYPGTNSTLMYPEAAGAIYIDGGITGHEATLAQVAAAGSILMSYSNMANATTAVQAAQVINSTLVMTNSNTSLSRAFTAAPGTAWKYPAKMRVYFAASSNALTASTTYCEKANTVRCYLAGVLQPTAALDLSAMTHYDIRYVEYGANPRTVSRGLPGTL